MTDHKEILKTYNAWRRDETGGKTLEDFGITPKMVGEAIDAVLLEAQRYAWLRDSYHGFEHYRADKTRPGAFEREIDDQISVQSWQPKGRPGNG